MRTSKLIYSIYLFGLYCSLLCVRTIVWLCNIFSASHRIRIRIVLHLNVNWSVVRSFGLIFLCSFLFNFSNVVRCRCEKTKHTMWASNQTNPNVSANVFLFDDRVKIGIQKAKNRSTLSFMSKSREIHDKGCRMCEDDQKRKKKRKKDIHIKHRRTKAHSKIITPFFV